MVGGVFAVSGTVSLMGLFTADLTTFSYQVQRGRRRVAGLPLQARLTAPPGVLLQVQAAAPPRQTAFSYQAPRAAAGLHRPRCAGHGRAAGSSPRPSASAVGLRDAARRRP